MDLRIFHSRHYDMGLGGLERMHPFDAHKYGKAHRRLRNEFGRRLDDVVERVGRQINRDELVRVHAPHYLDRLKDSTYVANALELPPLRRLPAKILDLAILRHMRWATMGTVQAALYCLDQNALAINLGGGYHHASRDRGEGFCIYSDIALAIEAVRRSGKLGEQDKILYVDLDAHLGNGVGNIFFDDNRVFIFDMFNQNIYPMFDVRARRRVDCPLPLPSGAGTADYLAALRGRLPEFIDSLGRTGPIRFAIYNAGTDIFAGDQLGGLAVSAEGVLQRDQFVFEQLLSRRIPTTMLLSGGYSLQSFELVADSIAWLLRERFAAG